MSYDPSHRMPPRQERWPQATPAEGWPSYRDGEAEQADRRSIALSRTPAATAVTGARPPPAFRPPGHRGHQAAVATAAFLRPDGYGATDGYRPMARPAATARAPRTATATRGRHGYARRTATAGGNGYGGAADGYRRHGYPDHGYAGATDGFAGA